MKCLWTGMLAGWYLSAPFCFSALFFKYISQLHFLTVFLNCISVFLNSISQICSYTACCCSLYAGWFPSSPSSQPWTATMAAWGQYSPFFNNLKMLLQFGFTFGVDKHFAYCPVQALNTFAKGNNTNTECRMPGQKILQAQKADNELHHHCRQRGGICKLNHDLHVSQLHFSTVTYNCISKL